VENQEEIFSKVIKEKNSCKKNKLIIYTLVLLILIGFVYLVWQKQQLSFQVKQLQNKFQEQLNAKEIIKVNNNDFELSASLAEVKHLIRLADIELVINHDVTMAIKLLTMADQRIKEQSNLTSVQRAIINDIEALKLMPTINVIEIMSKLNVLDSQILKLPIPNLSTQLSHKERLPMKTSEVKSKNFWQKLIATSLDKLQDIIIVKKHDQPIEPILSEEQQRYIIQRMQLELNQAQWAVLHKQQQIYQASLKKIVNLTDDYFASNPADASDIKKTIKELELISLTPKIPNLVSLTAIEQLNKTVL